IYILYIRSNKDRHYINKGHFKNTVVRAAQNSLEELKKTLLIQTLDMIPECVACQASEEGEVVTHPSRNLQVQYAVSAVEKGTCSLFMARRSMIRLQLRCLRHVEPGSERPESSFFEQRREVKPLDVNKR
ncbi:hypothetical protein CLAIMM_00049, partial [Cladophialophora immunda]